MKRCLRYKGFLFFSVVLSFVLFTDTVHSRNLEKGIQKGETGPMVINSRTLEADDRKKTVEFKDDVEAKTEDFTIHCQLLVVYYEKAPGKKGADESGTRINKIIATGDVKILRNEGGTASAKKAVYYHQDEKLILTGKPVVQQGDNFVEGDRITLFLKEDRSLVESLKNKKVKAVIFPDQEKRQGP